MQARLETELHLQDVLPHTAAPGVMETLVFRSVCDRPGFVVSVVCLFAEQPFPVSFCLSPDAHLGLVDTHIRRGEGEGGKAGSPAGETVHYLPQPQFLPGHYYHVPRLQRLFHFYGKDGDQLMAVVPYLFQQGDEHIRESQQHCRSPFCT